MQPTETQLVRASPKVLEGQEYWKLFLILHFPEIKKASTSHENTVKLNRFISTLVVVAFLMATIGSRWGRIFQVE